MTDPLAAFNPKATPQSQQAEPTQVQNSAGGYSFQITPQQMLERFLILGTWSGSYYTSEKDLTKENVDTLLKLVKADGRRVVDTVMDVSLNNRAYKQQPTLFALAVCAKLGDADTRAYALSKVAQVCRTGTMLYQFVSYVEQFGGWGSGTKRAIANWYTNRPPNSLANQMVKYRSRSIGNNSWTHRDLIRLSHPKLGAPTGETQDVKRKGPVANHKLHIYDQQHPNAAAIAWADQREVDPASLPVLLQGYVKAIKTENLDEIITLIEEYNLPWEALPTEALNETRVWEALVPHLGLTAVMRNLGKMGATGGLTNHSNLAALVNRRLTQHEELITQRVHPMQVLLAANVYSAGRGVKGKNNWTPVGTVTDNLQSAFYASFGALEPTGKRRLVALDVSGSMMAGHVAGTFLTPRDATAALALVVLNQDPESYTFCFSTTFRPLNFSKNMRLDQAIQTVSGLPFSGTDCSLPMLHALGNHLEVDSFEIYTDSETWAGRIHPHQALTEYRKQSGIPAKMVINGMVSNGFSIANPNDAGSLDVIGFAADTPSAVASFISS